jgi:phosphoglycolate phosphatase
MKKRLLIFDLDGTIADTIYSIRDGVNMAMDKYGFPRRSYEEVRAAIGNGARELIRLSVPEDKRKNSALVDKVFEDYDKFYGLTYANVDGCYPNMDKAIRELHDRGYIIAVLSNKQDAYVKKIVDILFPDGVISFAAGQTKLPKKPDPTVPLMIAQQFGVTPDGCAFIGDSDVDVKTAKNSGMVSVACPWGYRPREELLDADFIIEDASELTLLFE